MPAPHSPEQLFAEHVQQRMALEAVAGGQDDMLNLNANGAHAAIRADGAMIVRCALMQKRGTVVRVLDNIAGFNGQTLATPKLGAGHAMSPVGPYKGPGGQHGPLRWLHYRTLMRMEDPQRGTDTIQLVADVPPDSPVHASRAIDLSMHSLRVNTQFENYRIADLDTSMGEHYYFYMPEGIGTNLEQQPTINGLAIDDLLRQEGAYADILQGTPYLWEGFDGSASINFADNRTVSLTAGYTVYGQGTPNGQTPASGMLLWHRPDTPTICFEPVAGVTPGEGGGPIRNQGISIPAMGALSMESIVTAA